MNEISLKPHSETETDAANKRDNPPVSSELLKATSGLR